MLNLDKLDYLRTIYYTFAKIISQVCFNKINFHQLFMKLSNNLKKIESNVRSSDKWIF